MAPGIFLRVFLKKHKLHNLIKEIDLGHFSWGLLDIWACYVIICFFFQILVQIFFFLGFFLLESPNILLSRTNYGTKFNFIGIKKTKGVSNFFLKVDKYKILNYYIYKKKFRLGWSCDHPGLQVPLPLITLSHFNMNSNWKINFKIYYQFYYKKFTKQ